MEVIMLDQYIWYLSLTVLAFWLIGKLLGG